MWCLSVVGSRRRSPDLVAGYPASTGTQSLSDKSVNPAPAGTTRGGAAGQYRPAAVSRTSLTGVSSQMSARSRRCSRSSCSKPAVATLTYVYADSTAVLGPLATYAEPHGYDLCQQHAGRLTAPRGWQVIRLADNFEQPPPTPDDLEALADAVREAGRPRVPQPSSAGAGSPGSPDGQTASAVVPDAVSRRSDRHPYLRSVPPLTDGQS
jgi:hypothetical protein